VELLSQVLSIAVMGVVLTLITLYLAGQLGYFVRGMFSFQDPHLGWDPTAGLDGSSWSRPRRSPDLDWMDWDRMG